MINLYKDGYIVSVYGTRNLKETVFLESEPSTEEIEAIVKINSGVKAYVSVGKQFVITQ